MLCENCTQGFKLDGTPAGQYLEDFKAYFHAGSPDGLPTSTAVVLLTDIFGLALNNPKILADEYSKALGVDVWVPDLFNGKPPVAADELEPYVPVVPNTKRPLGKRLKFYVLFVGRLGRLYAARPAVADKYIHTFLDKLKKERNYARVGAVGFCYGGGACIRFAATDKLQSVVIAHPGTNVGLGDISKIKIPNAWLCAEEDFSFSPAQRKTAEDHMASRKGKKNFVPYEFHDYEGTTHGFAARPALQHPKVKEAFEASFAATVEWFRKTIVTPPAEPKAETTTTEDPAPTALVAAHLDEPKKQEKKAEEEPKPAPVAPAAPAAGEGSSAAPATVIGAVGGGAAHPTMEGAGAHSGGHDAGAGAGTAAGGDAGAGGGGDAGAAAGGDGGGE
ncbi:alpha/beta-hydrolase [Auricularia subglabra TFB-10046 SS5]|nr:alpha/beta-hydrolase [Auricularia subglabra TFB-10046 SS5]